MLTVQKCTSFTLLIILEIKVSMCLLLNHALLHNYHCISGTFSHPLSESDPQFSSPMRSVVFPDDEESDQHKHSSHPESDIDPALLQAVLSDPVLLQAVDPLVLQAVLVSAASANLAKPNLPPGPQTTQYSQHSFDNQAYTLPQLERDRNQAHLLRDRSQAQLDDRNQVLSHHRQTEKSRVETEHSVGNLLNKRPNLHFESVETSPSKSSLVTSLQPINLPSPTYGSPDPLITHIGAPSPPADTAAVTAVTRRDFSEKQPAIMFE